jgi:outer membrane protein assembly factor BamB
MALGGIVTAPPAAQAGSAAVILDSGSLKAFSTGGAPLWTYASGGRLSPFLARSPEGHSYIARTNGVFITVNRVGRELWRRDLRAPLSGPPVCGWDGRLFIPAGDSIFCYTASGRQLWRRNIGGPPAVPPILDPDGGIVTALAGGTLLRLGPFGEPQTLYLSAVPKALVPLGSPGRGGRVLIVYRNGGMELADFRSADFDRGPQPLPRLEGRPLAAAGWGLKAAVLLDTGRLLGINGLTGEQSWSADNPVRAGPEGGEMPLIYEERGIYVLSRSGAAGFSEEGELLWRLDLKGTSSVPGFGDDGTLYAGGADWILYAFKMEDRVRRLPPFMYGPSPEGNYGAGSPPPSSWTGNPLRWEESLLDEQLRIIGEDIIRGRTGEREIEYTAFLMETAAAGRDPENPRRARVHISRRIRCLRFLALIGSRDTIPFLARIFEEEGEPAVKAAAAEAIGAIGQDKGGAAIQAFFNAVSRGNPPEDQVLTAVAAAAGALSRFSGPPLSEGGIRILSILGSSNRSNQVRASAKRELESLGK